MSLADFQRRALAAGELHTAKQNKAGQTRLLSEARRHADTAMLIAASDPIVAADAAHQAARKAILAVIDSHGFRIARTTRGHHLAVIEYAEHSGVFDAASTKQLRVLRQERTGGDYGALLDIPAPTADVAQNLAAFASRIVNRCSSVLDIATTIAAVPTITDDPNRSAQR